MGKKTKKRYQKIAFHIEDLYLPNKKLAVFLLRLEAASNDLTQIVNWVKSQKPTTKATREASFCKTRIRLGFQHRLLLGFMFECLLVIDDMNENPEFKEAEKRLTGKAKDALSQLRKAIKKEESSLSTRLKRARDSVIFHYDHRAFKKNLQMYLSAASKIDKPTSKMFKSQGEGYYYLLPEQIRDFATYGVSGDDDIKAMEHKVGNLLDEAMQLLGTINAFHPAVFLAYIHAQGIDIKKLDKTYVNE